MDKKYLEIKDLSVSFNKGKQEVKAVKNISFSLKKGETLGLLGESGSGKSVSALSILGLLDYNKAWHPSGSIKIENKEFLSAKESELRDIRGNKISMIFQEPMTSLNPLHTIEKQVSEVIETHKKSTHKQKKQKVIELLERVGLQNPTKRLKSFPHELSGGQRQRVMIAIALANNPDILIADEPTTALDVTIQKQIIDLLKDLQKQTNMGLLLITHDIFVMKNIADKVCVMKDGKIVEKGEINQVLSNPKHEYTKHLINSIPKGFAEQKPKQENIINTKNLKVWFPIKTKFLRRTKDYIKAVDGVDFDIKRGSTIGIVGESGSGKTTLGMALTRLISSSGKISFYNDEISRLSLKKMRPYRKDIQIVFQDPYGSLSPKMTIEQIIGEGLEIHHKKLSKHEKQKKIIQILDEVGLTKDAINKYPHEFSGGQRQRISIARAIVLDPKFIILDEPTSALDVSIQAQIIKLLKSLQKKHELTYLFISHDLRVVKTISDEIFVMKDGKIVERGKTIDIFNNPKEEYTKKLIYSSFDNNPLEK